MQAATNKPAEMKNIFLIVFALLCTLIARGQDSSKFFFDEVGVSVNRTHLFDETTEDRFGFGVGAYHSFRPEKVMNIVFGLELYHTSQFKERAEAKRFSHREDVTYSINTISVPVGARVNFGSDTKIFIEPGIFGGFAIYSKLTGTVHTYSPNENNEIESNEYKVEEGAPLSNSAGFYLGAGVRIPVSKYELIIKPDYRLGTQLGEGIPNSYYRLNIGFKW